MSYDPECRRCPLNLNRIQVVPCSGNHNSKVVLVGEAPGEKEDIMGLPFVGRAGKMLDRSLERANIERGEVMITNTVKCRPPGNRRPKEEEMAACRAFLLDDLAGKELVVALGNSASSNLLGRKVQMKEIVNQLHDVRIDGMPIALLTTYHPMACIYSKKAREDLHKALLIVRGYLDQ